MSNDNNTDTRVSHARCATKLHNQK